MKLVLILVVLISWLQSGGGDIFAGEAEEREGPPGPNEVGIAPNAVSVPLGRIVLVRRDSEYGAIKITKAWEGLLLRHNQYGKYESYYQGDETGDFTKPKVQIIKGKVSYVWLPLLGGTHGKILRYPDIPCGPIKLMWSYQTWVYFHSWNQESEGRDIELSPTKWSDISEVNVFDPRLKWYRYDEKRKETYIPIDQLWEDKEENKK